MSSTVVPPDDEVLDDGPELGPALRVEAGRGLVEEQHRRFVHERRREVEAASHPTRVRPDEPVAGAEQVEALEQRVGAELDVGSEMWVRRPTRRRFSAALRFSSTAAYCPASPIDARTRVGSSVTSQPSTRTWPLVGREQRREHADRGRLARTVRSEQPEHPTRGHVERDALQRLDVAEALDEVLDQDRRFAGARFGHALRLWRRLGALGPLRR